MATMRLRGFRLPHPACFRRFERTPRQSFPKSPLHNHNCTLASRNRGILGRRSRAKQNRKSTPVPRISWLTDLLLDGWLWLSLIGFFFLMYGTSLMLYSRWNHRENVGLHPVFHPWAIVLPHPKVQKPYNF